METGSIISYPAVSSFPTPSIVSAPTTDGSICDDVMIPSASQPPGLDPPCPPSAVAVLSPGHPLGLLNCQSVRETHICSFL